jgi:hypothetical protein
MKGLGIIVLLFFISLGAFGQMKNDTLQISEDKIHFINYDCQKCFVPDESLLYADKLPHVFDTQAEVNAYYKCPFSDSIDFDKYSLVHYPPLYTNKVYHVHRGMKLVGNNIIEEVIIVEPKLGKGESITMVGRVYLNDVLIPKLRGIYNAISTSKEIAVSNFDYTGQ